MTVRVARWSATHPWRAIALWVAFVAVCIAVGNLTPPRELDENDGAVGEIARAEAIIDQGDFDDPAVENVLITARSGDLDPGEAKAAAQDVMNRMDATDEVGTVEGPIPSEDQQALLVRVTISGDTETAGDRLQPLLDVTKDVADDHPAVRVEQVGGESIGKALDETVGDDFVLAEMVSLPVTLIILLIAFGALIAAGVPVLLALSAVGAAIGLSSLTSHLIPSMGAINSVILLVGMAVGVDYSLFYLKREREERARGRGHLDAVEIAAATSGHAVVVSGVAVVISMAGLYLAGDVVFDSLATGAILVVGVAVLGSLTVLPALLAKLGRWVDRPRVPLLWRLTQRQGEPRLWPAILRPALRYPAATLLVSVLALVALALPAMDMKLKFPGAEDVPRETAVMRAYDRMTDAFPSTGTSHTIAVKAPADRAGEVEAALLDLARRAQGDGLFASDQAQARPEVSADGTVTRMQVATPYTSRADEATDSLHRLRDTLVPETVGTVPGAEYAVGGEIAASVDYAKHVRQKLPLVMGFVLLLTLLVMALTFRSVVVAVTAILLNLLSVGAAYGLLTLVFQNDWAEGLLDFTSMGAVVAWLPMFLFVILFGLSMDYHVFVVSRIREAVRAGMPTRDAVRHGITTSAGVVSSAAIVMVAVFSIFGTLSTIDMKHIGVGLAVAILIDATIIRGVVLPSAMALLGRANWWAPTFLRRDDEPALDRPPHGRHAEPAPEPAFEPAS